jgi:hypothetical protein
MNRAQLARRDLNRRRNPIAAPAKSANISELGSGTLPDELVVIRSTFGTVV